MAERNSTTPSVAPRLLTIPRELRDLIYPYLYQEVQFHWRYKGQHIWSDMERDCEVCLSEAPLLSVLLTHSRLKEEYTEASCFKHLAATMRIGSHLPYRHRKYPPSWNLADAALAHVQHVTIFVDFGVGHDDGAVEPNAEFWGDCGLKDMANVLIEKSPCITTLRVGLHYIPKYLLFRPDNPYDNFTSGHFLHPPSTSLAGLPLVQRAEGYRIQCGDIFAAMGWVHEVVQEACYVFARPVVHHQLWVPEDMIKEWEISSYVDAQKMWWNEGLNDGRNPPALTTELVSLPKRMMGWREKRGHEEAKAWF